MDDEDVGRLLDPERRARPAAAGFAATTANRPTGSTSYKLFAGAVASAAAMGGRNGFNNVLMSLLLGQQYQ